MHRGLTTPFIHHTLLQTVHVSCCMPDIAPYLHAGGAKPRWQKQLPEVASYLGWCTWDAFYHDVSVQGIMSGLESFKCAGVQPRWIIIDDGWQVGVV